jgi:hypothetical protein
MSYTIPGICGDIKNFSGNILHRNARDLKFKNVYYCNSNVIYKLLPNKSLLGMDHTHQKYIFIGSGSRLITKYPYPTDILFVTNSETNRDFLKNYTEPNEEVMTFILNQDVFVLMLKTNLYKITNKNLYKKLRIK